MIPKPANRDSPTNIARTAFGCSRSCPASPCATPPRTRPSTERYSRGGAAVSGIVLPPLPSRCPYLDGHTAAAARATGTARVRPALETRVRSGPSPILSGVRGAEGRRMTHEQDLPSRSGAEEETPPTLGAGPSSAPPGDPTAPTERLGASPEPTPTAPTQRLEAATGADPAGSGPAGSGQGAAAEPP